MNLAPLLRRLAPSYLVCPAFLVGLLRLSVRVSLAFLACPECPVLRLLLSDRANLVCLEFLAAPLRQSDRENLVFPVSLAIPDFRLHLSDLNSPEFPVDLVLRLRLYYLAFLVCLVDLSALNFLVDLVNQSPPLGQAIPECPVFLAAPDLPSVQYYLVSLEFLVRRSVLCYLDYPEFLAFLCRRRPDQ